MPNTYPIPVKNSQTFSFSLASRPSVKDWIQPSETAHHEMPASSFQGGGESNAEQTSEPRPQKIGGIECVCVSVFPKNYFTSSEPQHDISKQPR